MKTIASETVKILTKNFTILSGIMGEKNNTVVIDKLALERLGFRFDYVSDAVNKSGIIHFGLFHFTYRFAHNKRVFINIDRERETISPFIFRRWSHEISEKRT